MTDLNPILEEARKAADELAKSSAEVRNLALRNISKMLLKKRSGLMGENKRDVQEAIQAKRPAAIIDRLTLSEDRIDGMATSLLEIAALPDPVGEIFDLQLRPNGLQVGRMRIPLGVIGIIFEARPNVVTDAGCLCLKSGNAVILRGGSEARHSNAALGDIITEALSKSGLPEASVQVLKDTDRELVLELLRARDRVDLVIPRGGEGLIRFVGENATVPLVYHYKGVCHVFVDRDADLEKAAEIVLNAKVQRPGVCNALETLLVHEDIAERFLPVVAARLLEKKVELRGCERSRALVPEMKEAVEEDWPAEFLDLILAVKVVEDFDEAARHIRRYGSGHTEAIITENYTTAGRFLREITASCVMVNASTRFNDGGELGLGAEIGISTTKLHAYGPMGLRELTASKFIVLGTGQVRG